MRVPVGDRGGGLRRGRRRRVLTFVGDPTLVGAWRDDLDLEHVRLFPFNHF